LVEIWARLAWPDEDVKASDCYEPMRNRCLLKSLAAERPASLVNLGPARLFLGAEGARLNRFVMALGTDERSHFMKATCLGSARVFSLAEHARKQAGRHADDLVGAADAAGAKLISKYQNCYRLAQPIDIVCF
jgi:hypothetical protein